MDIKEAFILGKMR